MDSLEKRLEEISNKLNEENITAEESHCIRGRSKFY